MKNKEEGEGFLARIMPATRILQSLTNCGKIDQECVNHAEEIIKEAKETYADYFDEVSKRHIREMEDYTSRLGVEKNKHLINLISASVANFRADSSMIGEEKYLNICSVFLRWVESIKKIDQDVQDVLNGYLTTIKKMMMTENLSENYKNDFTSEIEAACQRYFEKHKELRPTENIDNSCTLYVSERNHDCGIREE